MKISRTTARVAAAGALALGIAVPLTPAISGAVAAGHSTTAAAVTAGDSIVEVDKSNIAKVKDMAKTRPVVFLVTAPSWCGACQDLDPKIKRINAAGKGKWVLAIVDQDKAGGADREFRVDALPTMIAWGKNGEMSSPKRQIGSGSESAISAWIDKVVSAYGPVDPAPAPTTPAPAPTTPAPRPTTPAPTTPAPRPTTPAPGPTTPAPTTPAPGPTTPAPAPTTPAPGPTTPAPAPTDGKLPELPPGAVQLTDQNFESAVMEESKKRTVVIDFSKDQCGPCLQIAPILDEKYRADNGAWQYTRLDGTAYPELWKKFDNPWFPTLIAIKDGKEISRRTGFEGDTAAVRAWLDAVAKGEAPASDPLVMDVKTEEDWQSIEAMSKRHPVALRLHLDTMLPKVSGVNGQWAAEMAKGDGGKWTLANFDMSTNAQAIAHKHGVKLSSVPQMLVFYNGKVRLEPLNGRSTKEKMRAWVDTMLSTHYPEN